MFECDFFFEGTIFCEITWARKMYLQLQKKSSHSVNCTCSLNELIFSGKTKSGTSHVLISSKPKDGGHADIHRRTHYKP